MADIKREKYMENLYSLDPIEKDPFFETFNVFESLNLKGKKLIKALEITLAKSDELYSGWASKTDTSKIPGYRYHEGSFENGILTEDKIMKEVHKSISMLEYDHALLNMRSMANFYKRAYHRSKIYEPFFQYVNKILKKFKEIQEIIDHYEEKKFEIDQLHAEISHYQAESVELKRSSEETKKKYKLFENQYRKLFLNERVMKFFVGAVDKKIIRTQEGYTVFQIISRILWDGRMSKKDLAKQMGMSVKELNVLLLPHKEYFVFMEEYIDLNFDFEPIRKSKLDSDYDQLRIKLGLVEEENLEDQIKSQSINEKSETKEVKDKMGNKEEILDSEIPEEDKTGDEDTSSEDGEGDEIIEEEISDEELLDEDNEGMEEEEIPEAEMPEEEEK